MELRVALVDHDDCPSARPDKLAHLIGQLAVGHFGCHGVHHQVAVPVVRLWIVVAAERFEAEAGLAHSRQPLHTEPLARPGQSFSDLCLQVLETRIPRPRETRARSGLSIPSKRQMSGATAVRCAPVPKEPPTGDGSPIGQSCRHPGIGCAPRDHSTRHRAAPCRWPPPVWRSAAGCNGVRRARCSARSSQEPISPSASPRHRPPLPPRPRLARSGRP